jgi:cold shock CspA family protein
MTGTVALFSKRAYGFIEGEDRMSYFVHISQCGGRVLRPGDNVRFDVGDDPRNPRTKQAMHVTLINDAVSEKENSNDALNRK